MKHLNLSRVKFTEGIDVVKPGMTIFNPQSSIVSTLGGADQILGTSSINGDFGFGVLVGVAAEDFNSIIVSAEYAGQARVSTEGIKNRGIIRTNLGADVVNGTATANLSATVVTGSEAIAIADTLDTNVITDAFASIKFEATADGIDNYRGELHTNVGSDTLDGDTTGSVAAVAKAEASAIAIAEAIAEAPMSEGLQAFAGAMATSLAQATITAKGINNKEGKITTGFGKDTISATATSSAGTFAGTLASTLASATPENRTLATAIANAWAEAEDTAIAIDNAGGVIRTGAGGDTITATAKANDKAIAIGNTGGVIRTGFRADQITAYATGSESYGIYGGDILTGGGPDTVKASSFGGGVYIGTGIGPDFVQGFGDAIVDGGGGEDKLSFGSYNRSDFSVSLGANHGDVMFELDGITMKTTGFEQFHFADGIYSYDSLMG